MKIKVFLFIFISFSSFAMDKPLKKSAIHSEATQELLKEFGDIDQFTLIQEKKIKQLLSEGADPNATPKNVGCPLPPLITAILNDNLKLVQLLLDHGANANIRSPSDNTALMWAANHDEPNALQIMHLLIKHGAEVNLIARRGMSSTALILASSAKNNNAVFLLLSHGANPNLTDADGNTALIKASARGNVQIVNMLLQADANAHHTNKQGKSALQITQARLQQAETDKEREDYLEIIEMLNNPQNIKKTGFEKII